MDEKVTSSIECCTKFDIQEIYKLFLSSILLQFLLRSVTTVIVIMCAMLLLQLLLLLLLLVGVVVVSVVVGLLMMHACYQQIIEFSRLPNICCTLQSILLVVGSMLPGTKKKKLWYLLVMILNLYTIYCGIRNFNE